MSIFKDFLEFRKSKKEAQNVALSEKNVWDINTLYFCNVGDMDKQKERGNLYHCRFRFHAYRLFEELTPKEIKQHLEDTYGKSVYFDWPKYQEGRADTIRYFRDPFTGKVIPLLTFDDIVKTESCSISCVYKAVPMIYAIKNKDAVNQYLIEQDIKDWETAYTEASKGYGNPEK